MPDTRSSTRGPRTLAAALCVLEAVVAAALAAVYGYELVDGGSGGVGLVAAGGFLVICAVALGFLARGWVAGADWPRSPTVVWNLLLVPVGFSLSQGGQRVLGGIVVLVAVASVVAALRVRPARADGDHRGDLP